MIRPCRRSLVRYVKSIKNKAILMRSAKEILKTKHNGKSNPDHVTISTTEKQQKVKAPSGNWALHPE